MLLTMPSARLPCSAIFSRLPVSISIVSSISARLSSSSAAIAGAAVSFNSSSNSTDRLGEIVDEVERVLDLVRDSGGQLAQRRHLLGLDQARLRRPQFAQRRSRRHRARPEFRPPLRLRSVMSL